MKDKKDKGKTTKPAANASAKADPKAPPLALLAKLGSIAVHADELLSADGHAFDRTALETLLRDPEVAAWIKAMGPLLPKKRN